MSSSLNVDEVLDRAKMVAGVRTDADLSRFFGKFKTAATNWRSRGTIPLDEIVELAETHNVSLDWILTGRGSREVVSTSVAEPEPVSRPKKEMGFGARLERLRRISASLQEIEEEENIQIPNVSVIMEIAFKHQLDKEGIRGLLHLVADDNTE